MYLKQKRCGRIKARGCADGCKQCIYKTKEETSSLTISTEAVFLTCLIDAKEGRYVVTTDIPGAFMHAEIDEEVYIRLEGTMMDLLVQVNPKKYVPFVIKEKHKNVIYLLLHKALYGMLQAALLFWRNRSSFLVDKLGFKLNPYDTCITNKIIDGKQCTIGWHVDDLKILHVNPRVVESIVAQLNNKYGKEEQILVNRGKVHDYLGMTIDYSVTGKVLFGMQGYVDQIISEAPSDMRGTAATPTANYLYDIDTTLQLLHKDQADMFHHITAQLLYLCKRAWPDIQTAIAFLCTRVSSPSEQDWKKLSRCIRYLRGTRESLLMLEGENGFNVKWWVDASFAIHPDMQSQTGMTMTLGKGCVFSGSVKQKINTRSSTEAELIGVNDSMLMVGHGIFCKNKARQ